jgi:glycosyltransferase involved in cell wall biosynthesis
MLNQNTIQNNPLVSIVLCTYNGAMFIEEQLKTVCSQTYNNLEIIIADDCSKDNTFLILEKLAKEDSRIRLIRNEFNLGYNMNFNNAVHLTTGSFIAFCDQDDLWEERKIETLLNAWPEKANLIYSDSVRFEGKLDKANCKKNLLSKRFYGDDPRKLAIFNTVSGHALMIKKSFLEVVLPFHKHIFYDWYMAVIAASNGGVAYVDEILVYQRAHNNNASFGEQIQKEFKNKKEAMHNLVSKHLLAFMNAPSITSQEKDFFITLSDLFGTSLQTRKKTRLFLFLMKNRETIFWYKKRKIGFFSHLKHSFIISFI